MGVLLFYLLALIPVVIGTFLAFNDEEVVWQEWLIGVACAFLFTGVIHFFCIRGMLSDSETVSGFVTQATHHPRWVESYQVTDYCTDKDGNSYACGSHTEYRTHHEYWDAEVNFGSAVDMDTYEIEEAFWRAIQRKFNDLTVERPWKVGFDSGDRNVYVSYNKTGAQVPATKTQRFENRIKAAPSLFSYSKVPKDSGVYEWPENKDHFNSQRLLGTAANLFDQHEFDCLNSRLGPAKLVNVILVGFIKEDSAMGHTQEAAWIGGKKNDLVICFGGMSKQRPARWVHVFGWTERDLCKRNIEQLLREKPATPSLLSEIEKEIQENYVIKDWTKFDYITVEPPTWAYYVFFIGLLVTQSGLYYIFHNNSASRSVARFDRWKH